MLPNLIYIYIVVTPILMLTYYNAFFVYIK